MACLPQPSNLSVEALEDRSLRISWKHEKSEAVRFHLKLEYFNAKTSAIKPEDTEEVICEDLQIHIPAREELGACTIKVSVQAAVPPNRCSAAVVAQVAWDDELPPAAAKTDLHNRVELLAKELDSFCQQRGSNLQVVVVGAQHHGKSSFVNHVYRCMSKNLRENDQMESAPAGSCEKTLEVKTLAMQGLSLMDTPAFPNMSQDMVLALEALLARGVSEGTRRNSLMTRETGFSSRRFFLQKPPHAAVLVISLCHWRDQQDEMRDYLTAVAKCFKNASQGMVAFPFVVAATHRDEFLQDCKAERPHEELQMVVSQIRRAANTNYVFAVTSYGRQSRPSASVNEETFQLISQLVSLAGHQDTGRVVASTNQGTGISMFFILVAFAVAVLAAFCAGHR